MVGSFFVESIESAHFFSKIITPHCHYCPLRHCHHHLSRQRLQQLSLSLYLCSSFGSSTLLSSRQPARLQQRAVGGQGKGKQQRAMGQNKNKGQVRQGQGKGQGDSKGKGKGKGESKGEGERRQREVRLFLNVGEWWRNLELKEHCFISIRNLTMLPKQIGTKFKRLTSELDLRSNHTR